jgi:diguanylate cyclase (GGDEF)-like protein/PAS domain S-box-containing protein
MGSISASAELAEALIRSAETGIYIVQDGRLQYFNTLFVKLTGYKEEELLGGYSLDYVYPDDRERVRQKAIDNLKGLRDLPYEYRLMQKSGELLWVMEKVTSSLYGGRRATVGSFMDITFRKKAEVELRLKSDLLDAVNDAIVLRDKAGNIIYANELAYKSHGYTREEYMNLNLLDILTADCVKNKKLNDKILREKGYAVYISEIIGKDGTITPVEVHARVIKSENKEYILSVGRDITERRQVEKQLTHMATHDPLTGLPNRMLFHDRLATALENTRRSMKRLAVMILDLDGFKVINDTLGHTAGDHLLIMVSERLRSILRKSDTIARMGGDEFMILVTDINTADNIGLIAQKVLNVFKEPFVLDGQQTGVTVSIGIAVYPEDGETSGTLIQNADKSMYAAKEQGRNRYQRYAGIHENTVVTV